MKKIIVDFDWGTERTSLQRASEVLGFKKWLEDRFSTIFLTKYERRRELHQWSLNKEIVQVFIRTFFVNFEFVLLSCFTKLFHSLIITQEFRNDG